jgi:hypothetical protein
MITDELYLGASLLWLGGTMQYLPVPVDLIVKVKKKKLMLAPVPPILILVPQIWYFF